MLPSDSPTPRRARFLSDARADRRRGKSWGGGGIFWRVGYCREAFLKCRGSPECEHLLWRVSFGGERRLGVGGIYWQYGFGENGVFVSGTIVYVTFCHRKIILLEKEQWGLVVEAWKYQKWL